MEEEIEQIAIRLRSWRTEARLTLQQLAELAGVSASTIHKIENHQTVPTIVVLMKIADGLNRPPSELLEGLAASDYFSVVRGSERNLVSLNKSTSLEQLVGPIPGGMLEVWRACIEPVVDTGKEVAASEGRLERKFTGEMVILVEDGCVEVAFGDEVYSLGIGDSIHFDTSLPHRWGAGGDKPAQAMLLANAPERLVDVYSRASTRAGD